MSDIIFKIIDVAVTVVHTEMLLQFRSKCVELSWFHTSTIFEHLLSFILTLYVCEIKYCLISVESNKYFVILK